MTSVAILIDQLLSTIPGGMGTYTRELVPALGRADPSLELVLFHSRFATTIEASWTAGHRVEPLRHDIRRLYPGWALLGRPALPRALGSVELVHSPTPVAVPPGRGQQRLVVTVHDLAFMVLPSTFPPVWRTLYRVALRRTVRTAHAVISPSRHTAEDLIRRTGLPAERIHVIPEAAALPESSADPAEVLDRLKVRPPYIL